MTAAPPINPSDESTGHELKSVARDEAQQARRRTAERRANSELSRALRDDVAQHAVQTRDRENDRHRRERSEQTEIEPRVAEAGRDDVGHRHHSRDRGGWIDSSNGGANAGHDRRRIALDANHERKARRPESVLTIRPIHLGGGRGDWSHVANVAHHADDRRERRVAQMEARADRVETLEVAVDERLVDDDGDRRVRTLVVAALDETSGDQSLLRDREKTRRDAALLDQRQTRRIVERPTLVAHVGVRSPVDVRRKVDRADALDVRAARESLRALARGNSEWSFRSG